MKKKGRGPWVNLLDKSEVLTLLLEIHGLPTVFILITSSPPSESRSTIWGGRACHIFVSVLGRDGTKIAPHGDLFDRPPGEMN